MLFLLKNVIIEDGDTMNTIKKEVRTTYEISKSRFITSLKPVESIDDAKLFFAQIKDEFDDATHNVTTYIIGKTGEAGHYSDDGEPSGTAGLPALDVFRKNKITNFACVITRYFGGIKLGAGGLIRAYANSTKLCLKKTKIIKLEKLLKIKIIIPYEKNKTFLKIINEENILEKNFDTGITYIILISEKRKELLDSLNFSYEVLDENYF